MRMQGHAQHDDARYVPKAMLEEWATQGSDRAVPRALIESDAATEKELDDIDTMTKSYAAEGGGSGGDDADARPGDRHARRLRRRRLRRTDGSSS